MKAIKLADYELRGLLWLAILGGTYHKSLFFSFKTNDIGMYLYNNYQAG